MKIAVLGLGFMGGVHLRALQEIEGAELAAVFSNDERQLTGDLSGTQGNLGGPAGHFDFSSVKRCRELSEVFSDPEIEAVDLCLPTHFHESAAIQALRAGKHVLVEKPMALDGPAARRMVAEAERSGRILMAAQVIRFFPEYVALRNALPALGPVRSAFFRRRCAAPAWGGWLKDPLKSGGGVFDLLIHDLDFCLHLFGAPEAIAATGYTDVESGVDLLDARLFYPLGAVTVAGGWQQSGAYPFGMEYNVTAEKGAIEFRSADLPPTLYTDTALPLALAGPAGYTAELAYFIECCRHNRQPDLCPPRQSAQVVELMRELLDARERNGEKLLCSNQE
jgi:predicted dehydrogenase